MGRQVSMEVGDDGIALVTLNKPPVNSLDNNSPNSVMAQLKEVFLEAHSHPDVKAIVVKGANGRFSGGADIGFLQNQKPGNQASRHQHYIPGSYLFNKVIEGGPKPAVAAIETFALGGGLELAMACHARIVTPKAQLGLPELQLGIIPGLGGTQRLPRLIGLRRALDMMLMVKLLSSEEANKAGLIDAVVPLEELESAARKWALEIASGKRPWRRSLELTDRIGSQDEALNVVKQARADVQKTYRNVPHPFLCLDAVEEGIIKGAHAGTLKEEDISKDLVLSPTAKGLMHIFFAQRSAFKIPGVTDQGLKASPIRKVAVVGGGLMGSGIATAVILSGMSVYLKEINPEFLEAGMHRIKENLKNRMGKGGMTEAKMQKTLSLVTGTLDYADFRDVDIVIEAVIEDISLKQVIFSDLEKYCKPTCLLASNTSSIDLGVIGANTKSQDRIIGAHFFSPAHVMPLLEIVRAEKTSAQTILDLLTLGKVIKKVPVVVRSCVGFAVNRVFYPYFQAAYLLVNLGIHPYRIDAIVKDFGMPMGPFRLLDLTGVQLTTLTSGVYKGAYGDRVYLSPLAPLLVKDNRLGEKTGKGFYNYKGSRKELPAPELDRYLAQSRKLADLIPDGKAVTLTDQEILEIVFFPVVNEACRALQEDVVVRSADLDIASVLGMGFPAYRGGVVFWGDFIGPERIFAKLSEWSSQYGEFFKPSFALKCAVDGKYPLAQIVEQRPGAARL